MSSSLLPLMGLFDAYVSGLYLQCDPGVPLVVVVVVVWRRTVGGSRVV